MTTYKSGTFDSFYATFDQWYKSDSTTLVFVNEDVVINGKIKFRELERMQEEYGMGDWPEDVVVSYKCRASNPTSDKLPKWDEEVVQSEGYWYTIAVKVNVVV